ncbi:DUF3703 domain-containing protein [Knoellia subterranea]|uniref:DUF3703 domain-containing protein n=1 Tax=Knoellia subterranea KCTC 19937 TaxID=1385521 RepID=A0A0A0JIK5_9MICO|nr:DUF3703 domain-containing protein [Knoellia subterranea]KGN36554.1 hypothetical protein N803_03585 [Knoellia subterranea KCTC 19937]
MPTTIRAAFDAELRAARTATTGEQRWAALERAHILSQPWAWPHTRAHAIMLRVAWSEHDRREAAGQVLRLLIAAPGSALGRYPEGNTGRATVPLTKPMPVPDDLAKLLDHR